MRNSSFRVGTFNLCNLALPNVFFYPHDRYSPEVYAQKKLWTAQQLMRMRADLVGFQEVFHAEALEEAIAASQLYDKAQLIVGKRSGDSPAVALVSRFPVLDYRVIEKFPAGARLDVQGAKLPLNRFSRPVLAVRVALSRSLECTVFVVHLKSKRPIMPDNVDRHDPIEKAKGQARSLILRAAEATALRLTLMELLRHRDYPVIVMGDVNDGGLAVTTQIVAGEPPHRQLEPEFKRQLWDVLLYNVKDIQARRSYSDFYYTHIHNGHYESLDHVLISQEFASENPRRIGRVSYVSVFNDHLIDATLTNDPIEPWQSDHGQVVATIELSAGGIVDA